MRPEVLAPAGDAEAMRAAVRAGADAVYFGLQGFNARARASNFDAKSLRTTLDELHGNGVRGYITLNTLVFDQELPAVENAIRAAAGAGADAIIVQDLGVAALARAIAPELPVHASTQMTCTDAASVNLARSLGAKRVVLARELSLDEIAEIQRQTEAELEVFVHGALCVAYSGQCLTSEAIGGRSANRGACAQACRLPYELLVDGVKRDLGDKAHLLSPQDLEASALVPRLAEIGVRSLKIEGRLKGPEYVAAAVRLYRAAIDNLERGAPVDPALVRASMLTYSRGSGPGFLSGVDHQRLVDGHTCEHRGLPLGTVLALAEVRGQARVELTLLDGLARGDGIMIEGGFAGAGELGGRVWTIHLDGRDVEEAPAGARISVWLGPDRDLSTTAIGRRIFKTDEPRQNQAIQAAIERDPAKVPLRIRVEGAIGEPFRLLAESARGHRAEVIGEAAIETATLRPIDAAILEEKLGRLGDTPFALGQLEVALPPDALIPLSALNRARRALSAALIASAARSHPQAPTDAAALLQSASVADHPTPPPGLFVLARNEAQAVAALSAGADGVYLDFLELVGVSRTLERLRKDGAPFVGLAPPRIRKPGDEKIDRHLGSLEPDAILVRSLGALEAGVLTKRDVGSTRPPPLRIGDFSLNVTNRLSAAQLLGRGLDAFTPAFDLDADQLVGLLRTSVGRLAELVLHHPMPLFHMEHCVFAAILSTGSDYRSCGRPCERHQLSLIDRAGMAHPIEADVGCRNTVFHAAAQSSAGQVEAARAAGVGRFRIELVRESAEDTKTIVAAYRALFAGKTTPGEIFRNLRTEAGTGVVRGSLRVLG
ncbi:MAG: DUF3656 domain-containing protein [Myxococcota bacterium]